MVNKVWLTLDEFWNSFVDTAGNPTLTGRPARAPNSPIPAFIEGYAKERNPTAPAGTTNMWRPARPPYITYPLVLPNFAENTLARVTVWDQWPTTPGQFSLVIDVLAQMRKAIHPTAGVILNAGEAGLIVIHRENVISPPADEDDPAWVRGIMNLRVTGYVF